MSLREWMRARSKSDGDRSGCGPASSSMPGIIKAMLMQLEA
jgi:hypothetical protein